MPTVRYSIAAGDGERFHEMKVIPTLPHGQGASTGQHLHRDWYRTCVVMCKSPILLDNKKWLLFYCIYHEKKLKVGGGEGGDTMYICIYIYIYIYIHDSPIYGEVAECGPYSLPGCV